MISDQNAFPFANWRLIVSPAAPGGWNMAVDEAILLAVGRQDVPPTLRLYAWEPACLSLGYAQPAAEVDQAALEAHGWQLVRRPTGGRAILHTDELTYSVCGPQDDPRLSGSVLESYRNLAQALLQALHLLKIPAAAQNRPALPPQAPERRPAGNPINPVCFEVPSDYEITVLGKKLIGSAQARRREGVLQHGSFPLRGDLRRITQVLVFVSEGEREQAAARLLERATTAEAVLGEPLSFEVASEAFIAAFESALNLRLEEGELTPGEIRNAERLVAEKFTHPSWTYKV
mgnify:FL=1